MSLRSARQRQVSPWWKLLQTAVVVAATSVTVVVSQGAAIFIDVGNLDLLPNASGQVVEVFVQNKGLSDEPVSGLGLNVQVADSGPAPGSGSIPGPQITAVDILTGTIFQPNNTGQTDAGSIPQFANWTTTTSGGTVSLGAGTTTLLATITLDTTGFSSPQTWAFHLGATINGPTTYFLSGGADVAPTITDGTLTVVPEPRAIALASGLLLLGWGCLRRRCGRAAA